MSERNARAQDRSKRTIKDDLKDTARHLRDLLIAPKIRGDIRDAERERAVDEAVNGKSASLTIKKRRKAA